MTLDQCRPGERLLIRTIRDLQVRAMAIRLGMGAGAEVRCQFRLPRGPVVLSCGNQEIAIGHGIARQVIVQLLTAG
ncbi:MAG: FeoA family protein [bacterium]|nr:FeoA family protein [bacterium]